MTSPPFYSPFEILEKYRLDEEKAFHVFIGLTHSNMREIAEDVDFSRGTVQNYRKKFAEMHRDERLILFRYLIDQKLWEMLSEHQVETSEPV